MLQHAHVRIADHAPDFNRIEPPFAEHLENFLFAAFLRYEKHAFLRFAEQNLVGIHASLALRYAIHFDLEAHATTRAHFASRAGEAGGAHVLNANYRAGLHGFQAGFEQELF